MHRCKLDQIVQAYELFANQRDGVLKVAITPWAITAFSGADAAGAAAREGL